MAGGGERVLTWAKSHAADSTAGEPGKTNWSRTEGWAGFSGSKTFQTLLGKCWARRLPYSDEQGAAPFVCFVLLASLLRLLWDM